MEGRLVGGKDLDRLERHRISPGGINEAGGSLVVGGGQDGSTQSPAEERSGLQAAVWGMWSGGFPHFCEPLFFT